MIERPPSKQSLMALAKKVRVEFVDVAALFAADVALPGVGVAVAPFVQEVEGGVGECYRAECTYKRRWQHSGVSMRGRDHSAFGRRGAGSLQVLNTR